ncbi:MAG TPA: monofunctional biosynthetic peptidoglycan transglycosylase [Candidatus Krumholzibacteria bacterium]|nr:monofunctional biosynthetic peptidoglycan transglycosylase [Candidatus Krumholzibacteria bacterium]
MLRTGAWVLAAVAVLTVIPVFALRWINPPTSAFMMERRLDGLINPAHRVHIDYQWQDLDGISRNLQLAVIASEDQKFLEHEGFDFESIEKALQERQRRGRVRGASTISQQVAKNLFLWSGKTWFRKGIEAGYTVLIETLWTKRRILEVYLNIAEFGDGVYGVGAASPRYFGKSASRLSRHEAALLAAVLPNPRRMHADNPSRHVEQRAWWIERQMMRLGGHLLDPVEDGS